jgi:hypothetical protein
MSNIVRLTSVNLPKEISTKSRNVYHANSSIMIKNIDDKNIVVNSIHQSINRSIADKGVNMDIEDMNYLKRTVTDDILKDFPTLSLQDISLCFSMGVRGNLGDYFGLNVVTFYGWLKKYKEEVIPEAINEIKILLPPIETQEEDIDYKKLDIEKVENICNQIISYNETGVYDFNDYGNIHFKFLNKFGYFNNISDEEIQLMKEDAKELFISEIQKNNLDLISKGKKFQITNINQILEKIDYEEIDSITGIKLTYEKLLLKRFITKFKPRGNKLELFKKEILIKVEENYGK